MKYNKRERQGLITAICFLVPLFIPVVYCGYHPELSRMQVFMEFWWLHLGEFLAAIIFTIVNRT